MQSFCPTYFLQTLCFTTHIDKKTAEGFAPTVFMQRYSAALFLDISHDVAFLHHRALFFWFYDFACE